MLAAGCWLLGCLLQRSKRALTQLGTWALEFEVQVGVKADDDL
jgi:hypothetical protein